MTYRPLGRVLWLVCVSALLAYAGAAHATAPVLKFSVSRKMHNIPGVGLTPFDNTLTPDASGNWSIESRTATGTNGLTIVMTFDQPVVASSSPATTVGITSSTAATGMTAAAPVFSGNTVSVNLSGLKNQAAYTVTVNNIVSQADATGVLASASASFRTLLGDVNAIGQVGISDLVTVKFTAGQITNGANFRADLNGGGTIVIGDVTIVKFNSSKQAAPTGIWADTAPTITKVADQSATSGVATAPVGFTVGDTESDASLLYVRAASSNTTLLPVGNIVLAGTGASRTVSVMPAAGQVGSCVVSLIVSDGILSASTTFNVTVTSASTLYVATLTREDNTVSTTGTGTATLSVNAAGTQAVLRFQYSNLTSPKVSEHLHHGGPGVVGPIIYDIDNPAAPSPPTQQADGSYLWIFDQSPTANPTAAQIVSEIAAGNYYINIHTADYPNGEIRGQFNYAAGSQTFTPPVAPPAQPQSSPTTFDVSRFLTQATFGPSLSDINSTLSVVSPNTLVNGNTNSYDAWLNAQFAQPMTPIYGDPNNVSDPGWTYKARMKAELNMQSPDRVVEGWWHNAIVGPDQLRQRVAMAYSEIFVISSVDDNINFQSPGMASYHDMLAADAFVNFRQILSDVTLNPMMGQYLSMRGNNKQTLPAKPNENYAREIMQLFSIGLNLLQPDGTLKLDATSLPIPSYNQSVIEGFAQVFTGYDANFTYSSLPAVDRLLQYTTAGVAPDPSSAGTFNNYYHQPMAPTSNGGNHSFYEKDLLAYDGNYSVPPTDPTSDQFYIPATPSNGQTTATTNTDLNQALDNIFNHPNVGPFICRELIQRLVGSTPSPAYVYRVAQVFNNDGTGTRGNMQAVIKAILTDYEARAPQSDTYPLTGNLGYGHLREPLLCVSAAIRAFHPNSKTGLFKCSPFDNLLGQTIYRAPTVFNFFAPDYSDPGVIAAHNLSSPELYLATENTNVNYVNLMYAGVYNASVSTNAFSYGTNWPGSDVITYLDNPDGFTTRNGYTSSGSNLVNVFGYVGLATGQNVVGAGIPALTTIQTITPVIGVTISTNATATATGVTLTFNGTQVVNNCSTLSGTSMVTIPAGTLDPPQFNSVTGSGIPAGATVSNVYNGAATLTLSQAATATNNNVAFVYGAQFVSANTTINTPSVVVTSVSGLAVGQNVAGPGIPILSYITAINAGTNTLTLSQNATATQSGINLTYSNLPSEAQLAEAADVSVSPPPGVPAGGSVLSQLGLLDRLDLQLTGGSLGRGIPAVPATKPPTLMTNPAKARIATYVNSLPRGSASNDLARARAAANLILTTGQFAAQK